MARFPVYFHKTIEATVWVEAEDADQADELVNDGNAGWEDLPRSLCAHCAGFGQSAWSIDDAGEWEFEGVGEVSP